MSTAPQPTEPPSTIITDLEYEFGVRFPSFPTPDHVDLNRHTIAPPSASSQHPPLSTVTSHRDAAVPSPAPSISLDDADPDYSHMYPNINIDEASLPSLIAQPPAAHQFAIPAVPPSTSSVTPSTPHVPTADDLIDMNIAPASTPTPSVPTGSLLTPEEAVVVLFLLVLGLRPRLRRRLRPRLHPRLLCRP